jgi:hypothetical protein
MNRKSKNKSKSTTHGTRKIARRSRVARQQREAAELEQVIIASLDGIPPTDNLRKHPDEAYGDMEIPERGKALDQLKRESH